MEVTEEVVNAAVEALGDDLRKLGLYVDNAEFVPAVATAPFSAHGCVVLDAMIGTEAFSDRVLNPERHETNRTITTMEVENRRSAFDEQRMEMMDRLRRGESLLSPDPEPEVDG